MLRVKCIITKTVWMYKTSKNMRTILTEKYNAKYKKQKTKKRSLINTDPCRHALAHATNISAIHFKE